MKIHDLTMKAYKWTCLKDNINRNNYIQAYTNTYRQGWKQQIFYGIRCEIRPD